jgi:hypothetical protein
MYGKRRIGLGFYILKNELLKVTAKRATGGGCAIFLLHFCDERWDQNSIEFFNLQLIGNFEVNQIINGSSVILNN